MTELLLLSNSTAPGGKFLAHALDRIARVVPPGSRLLFVPYASGDPARYRAVDARQPCGRSGSTSSGRIPDAGALEDLAEADAVFVGGGNTFRLLRALREFGLLEAVRERVTSGLPYLGASAGSNVACPTIKTTNDMPIVEVGSLAALGLIPFRSTRTTSSRTRRAPTWAKRVTIASTSSTRRTTCRCSACARDRGSTFDDDRAGTRRRHAWAHLRAQARALRHRAGHRPRAHLR